MKREEMISAVMNRDRAYDGKFYYGDKARGVVCKPSCSTMKPDPEDMVFFHSLDEALQAGYKPCKECLKEAAVIDTKVYHSPCGDLLLGSFNDELCLCEWMTKGLHLRVVNRLKRRLKADISEGSSAVIEKAVKELDEYFAGKRRTFDLPILFVGTDFQKSVWRELLNIPYGHTATYAQQSLRIGRPQAIRAVGAANGANALSIIVPCHRVVGSDGSLTGYAGGIDIKKKLLDFEKQNL